MKNTRQAYSVLSLVAVLLAGCGGTPNGGMQTKQEVRDSAKVKASVYAGSSVYYTLPSPLEVAFIVENSGVGYESSILHKTELGVRYSTTKSAAINRPVHFVESSNSINANIAEETEDYLGNKLFLLKDGILMKDKNAFTIEGKIEEDCGTDFFPF